MIEELGLPEQDQMIAPPPRAEMIPPRSAATDQPILMITGGGLENGGGIGRMVGYVVAAWNSQVRPRMQVIDTRGPKYRRAVWPFFLLNSIFQIVKRAPQRPLLHVHLAANTSTLRKVIVTSVGRALGLKYVIHLHDPKYAEFYLRQRPVEPGTDQIDVFGGFQSDCARTPGRRHDGRSARGAAGAHRHRSECRAGP
ncbi:MAG: hypothetical protein WDN69_18920 [Aliidongia sp.]